MDSNKNRPHTGLTYVVPGMGDALIPVELKLDRKDEPTAAQTDGLKVGPLNISPHGDWRMPSDAEAQAWTEEVSRREATALQRCADAVRHCSNVSLLLNGDIIENAAGFDEDSVLRRYIDESPLRGLLMHFGNRDREEPESVLESSRRSQERLEDALDATSNILFFGAKGDEGKVSGEPIDLRLVFLPTESLAEMARRARPHEDTNLVTMPVIMNPDAGKDVPLPWGRTSRVVYEGATRHGKTAALNEMLARHPRPSSHAIIMGNNGRAQSIPVQGFVSGPPKPPVAERICEKCEGKGSYLLLSPFPHTCDVCHGKGKVV